MTPVPSSYICFPSFHGNNRLSSLFADNTGNIQHASAVKVLDKLCQLLSLPPPEYTIDKLNGRYICSVDNGSWFFQSTATCARKDDARQAVAKIAIREVINSTESKHVTLDLREWLKYSK
jgi:hypothetical protein